MPCSTSRSSASHQYKRQLLNILEAVATYADLVDGAPDHGVPRVKIFAGKAAPSYQRAKLIIKFINDVAKVVNREPKVGEQLKILFLPNYNVSLAQILIPAADLSEQVSTAGMEASGTGNMKFGLNGALTIGTLDGADVEMLEHVGPDNVFIFGLTAGEVAQTPGRGGSPPRAAIEAEPAPHPRLRTGSRIRASSRPMIRATSGRSSMTSPRSIASLRVTADFDSLRRRPAAGRGNLCPARSLVAKAVLNTARLGWLLESDRTVPRYAAATFGGCRSAAERDQPGPVAAAGGVQPRPAAHAAQPYPARIFPLIDARQHRRGRRPAKQVGPDATVVLPEHDHAHRFQLDRRRLETGLLEQLAPRRR